MTSISERDISGRDTAEHLRDWESPGRLLRRYLSMAGMQVIGVALCGLGFAVVAYGWWRISKESIVALQMPYLISAGIGGALMLGLGGVLLVAHDLRLDQRRLEVIEATLGELRDAFLADDADVTASLAVTATAAMPATTAYVRVANGKRYHAADCAAAAGKDVTPVDDPEAAGLQPCRLCVG